VTDAGRPALYTLMGGVAVIAVALDAEMESGAAKEEALFCAALIIGGALLALVAKRLPEINLDRHEIEWSTLPDGDQALHIGRGGDYFANCGEDLHAYGSLDPIVPGYIGCIVIQPGGGRYLAHALPDPLGAAEVGLIRATAA
jgi:hypothetical protein